MCVGNRNKTWNNLDGNCRRSLKGVQITYGQLLDGLQQTVSVEGDFGTDDSHGGRIAETRKCDPGIAVGLPSFFRAGKMAGRDGALIDRFLCLRS
jgi:hypothetical protein